MGERRAIWQHPAAAVAGPFVIPLLLLNGWRFDAFQVTDWYDVMMHLLGGFFLVLTYAGFLWHFWLKRREPICYGRLRAGLAVAVLLTAVVWEILEVPFHLTPNWVQSPADTFSDLFFSMAGAVVAAGLIRPGPGGSP